MGSDTKACHGLLCRGNLTPAVAASTLVWPEARTPSLLDLIKPFVVYTPSTL